MKFTKKKEYSFSRIAEITGFSILKIKSWTSLGIGNPEKTKVIRLKTHKDNSGEFATGKDIIEFLDILKILAPIFIKL